MTALVWLVLLASTCSATRYGARLLYDFNRDRMTGLNLGPKSTSEVEARFKAGASPFRSIMALAFAMREFLQPITTTNGAMAKAIDEKMKRIQRLLDFPENLKRKMARLTS